jgi:hypothetical protein
MPISIYMSPKAARTLTLVLALALAVVATESASARTKKRVQHPVPPSLMLDSGGTPIIMQGLEPPERTVRQKQERSVRQKDVTWHAERPRTIPRGSSGYVPPPVPSPAGGPPSPAMTQRPLSAYQPPPINSFSDRVTQCNHSFTFNAGIGNNPVGRDAYVATCAN